MFIFVQLEQEQLYKVLFYNPFVFERAIKTLQA